jgi:filamentous hemagglutinin
VFAQALGFNLSNWALLKQAILEALPARPATLTSTTAFGKKYEVVVPITGPNGRMVDVLTVWQFDRLPNSVQYADAPRLVTLYLP